MSTTTAHIYTTADELRAVVAVSEATGELFVSIKHGAAGAVLFRDDRPEDLAARLRHLADDVIGETARLRAEAAGQQKLEVA